MCFPAFRAYIQGEQGRHGQQDDIRIRRIRSRETVAQVLQRGASMPQHHLVGKGLRASPHDPGGSGHGDGRLEQHRASKRQRQHHRQKRVASVLDTGGLRLLGRPYLDICLKGWLAERIAVAEYSQ